MIIYVTGKSGSGKSTLAKLLAQQLGHKYIDIDKVGHMVYDNPDVMQKIYNLYGDAINDENGNFNRKKLGAIYFSEKGSDRSKQFDDITWQCMENILEKEMTQNCILDYMLLPITTLWQKPAIKILVKTQDNEQRIEFLSKRDGVDKEYIKLRDRSSLEYNESEFDFVIEHNYDEKQMKKLLDDLVESLKKYKHCFC